MTTLWKKKLAAWLHDPAEKALVLMRDFDNEGRRLGHEAGSVAGLRQVLGLGSADFDKRADHFASAADRPQWPFEEGRPRPDWANVRFDKAPFLVHPLNPVGEQDVDLGSLSEVSAPALRHVSLEHFLDLVERDAAGAPDLRLTQLAFWRFGPEPALAAPEIGELWRLLPADTRVPDHSIWSHLDVVSALAGALDGDSPALLTMSLGPVQGFIAQARSTSDLWAGSHLLSSLAWEGMKVICRALGPDAVLFPHLRGVAAVDTWLLEEVPAHRRDAWRERFQDVGVEWLEKATDANPLFAATLPNKFMVIVPGARAEQLAADVTAAVRAAALAWANEAATRVFAESGKDTGPDAYWRTQVVAQLQGFPEVHWSVAPWPLATDARGLPDAAPLISALEPFFPQGDVKPGFFGTPVWDLLGGEHAGPEGVRLPDGQSFFRPNAGLLYPAVHDLAERRLAAAKSLRDFAQLGQRGYRCSVTGEQEWLTHDAALVTGRREDTGAWSTLEGRFGIKAGERLGALATLKRLWPTLFADRVREIIGADSDDRLRYVISTHAMALATSMARALENPEALRGRLEEATRNGRLAGLPRTALPRSLHRQALKALGWRGADALARVPALLDGDSRLDEGSRVASEVADLLGSTKPETYYALIRMDGDNMGAWMSGTDSRYQRPFASSWHPAVRESVERRFGNVPGLRDYMQSPRPMSPARHAAISQVLNDFSTHVARHVIEEVLKGKLLYAGGDDVLAMLPVEDLLPAILLLRATYSGIGGLEGIPGLDPAALRGLRSRQGYTQLRGRLMPMMGSAASASIGAVVAHHKAPLASVMRELHAAESAAKQHGRNAFSIRLLKRGGGDLHTTLRFWQDAAPAVLGESSLGEMLLFVRALAGKNVSRRAVYNSLRWLGALPLHDDSSGLWVDMVSANLGYQFERQGIPGAEAGVHAATMVRLARANSTGAAGPAAVLADLLATAEFFMRESRMAEVE